MGVESAHALHRKQRACARECASVRACVYASLQAEEGSGPAKTATPRISVSDHVENALRNDGHFSYLPGLSLTPSPSILPRGLCVLLAELNPAGFDTFPWRV